MVQANELRLGNWVRARIRIDFPDYKPPEYLQCDTTMIRDCQHYKENWAWEGVLITPEILEKAGFVDCNPFELKNFRLDSEDRFIIVDSTGYGVIASRNIKYLHQLQNLYFAITGQELPINNLNTTN